jgi:hypothetical protein
MWSTPPVFRIPDDARLRDATAGVGPITAMNGVLLWQLIAAAGRDGRNGATGPRGERGERGSIGPRGELAPTITGWRVDPAAYAAVPLLSDGSEGAPLELRDLFKQFFDEVAPRA